jgi:peptidoglycan-associated lipoprotein
MTRVQRGRGGWVIDVRKIIGASVFAMLAMLLAVAGCASKKTKGLGENPNGANMGESSSGGSQNSMQQLQAGTLGNGQNGPLSDIHFAYNEYTIEPQDGEVLRHNAQWLNSNPNSRVQVEGHCDDRGSEDYNIALGAKRAQAAKDYLVTLGVSGSRISTISYGKELPLCTEQDDSCWAQNRRDHFAVTQ